MFEFSIYICRLGQHCNLLPKEGLSNYQDFFVNISGLLQTPGGWEDGGPVGAGC